MPKNKSKRGFTLVELCITLAVTMILLVDIIAFVSFIRVQIMNEKGASDGLGQATVLAEMIRADFYDDDNSESPITMGKDDEYWKESPKYNEDKSWSGYWNDRAQSRGYENIKSVEFDLSGVNNQSQTEINNGGIKIDSGDMVICTITYYTKSKGSDGYKDSTDTLKFVLIRKTAYVETTNP
ncbi:unknown [Eubacterium sp. CAG:841]|nr:unknown [Eubacterium sp. CAG:841]